MTENELIEGRRRILDGAIAFFSEYDDVRGAFLSGSLAEGGDDCFSDIDFRVLIRDQSHARFVEGRLSAPRRWSKGYLFNEWVPGTSHCVTHFEPFVKMDCFYLKESAFSPSPWYARPQTVLFDRDGTIQTVMEASKELNPEYSHQEAERMIGKAIASAHEALRRLYRSELLYTVDLIQDSYKCLLCLEGMLDGSLIESNPLSHLVRRRPKPEITGMDLAPGNTTLADTIRKLSELGLALTDRVDSRSSLENISGFRKAWKLSIQQGMPNQST